MKKLERVGKDTTLNGVYLSSATLLVADKLALRQKRTKQ